MKSVCESKRAFRLEVHAMTKALSIMNHPVHARRSGKPIYTYKCPVCSQFHLTSKREWNTKLNSPPSTGTG